MSVSMTMSMSSGLFGMISGRNRESSDKMNRKDSSATLNANSTPIRRHSASALTIPGGGGNSSSTSGGCGGGGEGGDITSRTNGSSDTVLMHSVSEPHTGNGKVFEMPITTPVIDMCSSPRILRRLSPCNNTGITIVIDKGSLSADEDSSSSSDSDNAAVRDPLLSNNIKSNNGSLSNGANYTETVDQSTPLEHRRVSHVSQNSQVHLLS